MTNDDEPTLRRYLLGKLSVEEADHLEERYLEDEGLFDRLSIVEDELIDQYVREQLSASDRGQFEKYFLSSQSRREKIEDAKAIKVYAAKVAGESAERQISVWQKLRDFLLPRTSASIFAMAASLVMLVGCGFMGYKLIQTQSQFQVISTEQAALRERNDRLDQELNKQKENYEKQLAQQQEENRELTNTLAQEIEKRKELEQNESLFALATPLIGLTEIPRGAGEAGVVNQVVIKPGNKIFGFPLILDKRQYDKYLAELRDASGHAVESSLLKVLPQRHGKIKMIFAVLTAKLQEQNYSIRLKGKKAAGEYEDIREYRFKVKRGSDR